MDLSKLSDEELLALYQSVKGGVSQSSGQSRIDPVGEANAAMIALGRTGSRVVGGIRDVNTSIEAAKAAAIGKDVKPFTSHLSATDRAQREESRLYEPLAKEYPIATGLGENLPMMATPMGQASAVGRIAAPAVMGALLQGSQPGSLQERGIAAARGGVEGLAAGGVGEAISRVIKPVTTSLPKSQRAAIKGLEDRLGVKARPSQLTGSQSLADLEDMLAQSPGGSGVWRDFNQANKSAINKAAAGSVGSNADAPTREVLNAQKDALGAAYEGLRAGTTMPVTGDVFEAIGKSEQMLSRGAGIKGKDEALNVLADLKEKLYNAKMLSGDDYQAWTSDLATIARETKNSTVKAAVRQVEKAMDRAARETNAPKWEAADSAWANLKTLLRPNAVNEISGDVSPRGVYLAQQVSQGEGNKLGKIGGPMRDIADYGKALPALREGSQTAKRGMFSDAASLLFSPLNYGASKGMTSGPGRGYLSGGLLGDPNASAVLSRLAGGGSMPLTAAELEKFFGLR